MAQIQFPSQVPCIIVGGRVFTDLDNLIEIQIYCDSTAAQRYSTMRLASASSGYVVPASKSLYLSAFAAMLYTAAAAAKNIWYGYGDTDVGITSAAAPTNAVYPASSIGTAWLNPPNANGTVANPRFETAQNFVVPTGKYAFITGSSGIEFAVHAYGYAR